MNLGGSRTCFCSAPPLKEAFLASWSEKRPLSLSDPKGQVSPKRGNAGQASDMTQQTLLLAYRPSVCVANHCLSLGRGVGRKTHGHSWGSTGRFAGLLTLKPIKLLNYQNYINCYTFRVKTFLVYKQTIKCSPERFVWRNKQTTTRRTKIYFHSLSFS